jgi:hypothetical protein
MTSLRGKIEDAVVGEKGKAMQSKVKAYKDKIKELSKDQYLCLNCGKETKEAFPLTVFDMDVKEETEVSYCVRCHPWTRFANIDSFAEINARPFETRVAFWVELDKNMGKKLLKGRVGDVSMKYKNDKNEVINELGKGARIQPEIVIANAISMGHKFRAVVMFNGRKKIITSFSKDMIQEEIKNANAKFIKWQRIDEEWGNE